MKRCFALLLTAVLSIAAAHAQDAQEAQVELRPQAQPRQHQLTLEDIAQVRAADPVVRAMLQETVLLHLPGQKQGVLLTRERVQRMLNMRLPALQGRVVLTGARSVLVAPPPPLAVRAGSEVLVELTHGGLRLSDRAISMDDGEPGSSVRIKNPRNQQSYRATVLASGLVGVQ